MSEEQLAGGKSLAEQRIDLERLQITDPARYALQSAQDQLDKITAEQISRGEIDEMGRQMRNANGEVIPPHKRR